MADFPALLPVLSGRTVTIDEALKYPNLIRDRIAKIADDLMVAPNFYNSSAAGTTGGAILFSILRMGDMYVNDVLEERNPGAEYLEIQGMDPEVRLATVKDWGGRFRITDERRIRNDIDYFDQQTMQLANTIAKKIDDEAFRALNAMLDSLISEQADVVGHSWSNLTFVGPLTGITPSNQRPSADWSAAQLAADLQQLGVKHDVLVVSPSAANNLRTAYAEGLDLALKSAGLELVSNVKVPVNTCYVAEKGQVGLIGFEEPLNTISWPDYDTRSTVVQAWAVPAFAVTHPFRVKRITGIL